mmetsp:Transcript_21330/g.31749  ORF Transcript_21330/g.31749 Transcript_21330/m.31749 type:complete len:234 (+) Transcript_21330:3-704(+)
MGSHALWLLIVLAGFGPATTLRRVRSMSSGRRCIVGRKGCVDCTPGNSRTSPGSKSGVQGHSRDETPPSLPSVNSKPENRGRKLRVNSQFTAAGWLQRLIGPRFERPEVSEILSEDQLESLLRMAEETNKLTVVMLSMTFCGPCKLFEPKYTLFAEDNPDATFVKIIGDRNEDTRAILDKLGVKAVPAFRIYKGTKDVSGELSIIQQMDLVQSERALRAVLKRNKGDQPDGFY